MARPSSDMRRLRNRHAELVARIKDGKRELEEIAIAKRVLARLPDGGEDDLQQQAEQK